MNDDFEPTQPTMRTEPASPLEPDTDEIASPDSNGPTQPTRRRVRWYHVATLGVAVLACAAGIGFFTSQSSDRDEAATTREHAQERLADQRADTTRAHNRLARERTETTATLADVAVLTTTVHELSDLTAQEVDALATLNQQAVATPDAVDDFNSQVDHARDLLDQMEAKGQQIVDQANQLRDRADAQYATFRRGARASVGRTAPS